MRLLATIMLLTAMGATAQEVAAPPKVRIKDVARFEGRESYSMIGYGLVIGLAGSGDSDEELTQQTIGNVLQNFNIKVDESSLKAKNCAVVMVTVELREGGHRGDLLTGTVATVGDAESLAGGELILTPLLGPDGEPWAVAQGALTVGGFHFGSGGAGGETQTKNHPTAGKLANGVKLLRDIDVAEVQRDSILVYLKQPDYTTAVNLAAAVNAAHFGAARALNHSTVRIAVPAEYLEMAAVPTFLSQVEQLTFVPDQRAKIVFSERTGTIVIGRDVRISSVAISHGSISVNIKSTTGVSQPAPFRGGGSTAVVEDQTTTVNEDVIPMNVIPSITSVGDLVDMLNTLGVTPRDIMAIFIALQQSGALHADIENL